MLSTRNGEIAMNSIKFKLFFGRGDGGVGKKTFTTHNTLDWHQSLSGKAVVVVVGDGVVISEFVVAGQPEVLFLCFSPNRC